MSVTHLTRALLFALALLLPANAAAGLAGFTSRGASLSVSQESGDRDESSSPLEQGTDESGAEGDGELDFHVPCKPSVSAAASSHDGAYRLAFPDGFHPVPDDPPNRPSGL